MSRVEVCLLKMSQKTVLDGGYGWVICFVSFYINVIADGIGFSFGVIVPEIIKRFGCDTKAAVSVGSINCGVTGLSGLLTTTLANIFGCRKVAVLGALVSTGVFIASAFATDITSLTLIYGVLGGLSLGMTYLPTIISVNLYFEEKRALASSITMSGSSFGYLILAPILNLVLENFGLKCSFGLMAILSLTCAILGLTLKSPPVENEDCSARHNSVKPLERSDIFYRGSVVSLGADQVRGLADKAVASDRRLSYHSLVSLNLEEEDEEGLTFFQLFMLRLSDLKVLKDPTFLMFFLFKFFFYVAYLMPYLYIPVVMLTSGHDISSVEASLAITALGIANGIARLLSGVVTNFPQHTLTISGWCSFMAGVSIALFPHCTTAWHFYIASASFGFFMGPPTALTSVAVVRLVGMDLLSTAYGLTESCYGLLSLLSPTLATMLADFGESFALPFYAAAGSLLLSSGFCYICNKYKRDLK